MGGHQLNQGNQVDGGDSLAATLLLLLAVILGGRSGLARVVFPKKNQQSALGVLVGLGLGLQEDGKLTQGGLEFFLERLVGRLWKERLLLEDGPDAHGLLKHDDGSSQ